MLQVNGSLWHLEEAEGTSSSEYQSSSPREDAELWSTKRTDPFSGISFSSQGRSFHLRVSLFYSMENDGKCETPHKWWQRCCLHRACKRHGHRYPVLKEVAAILQIIAVWMQAQPSSVGVVGLLGQVTGFGVMPLGMFMKVSMNGWYERGLVEEGTILDVGSSVPGLEATNWIKKKKKRNRDMATSIDIHSFYLSMVWASFRPLR